MSINFEKAFDIGKDGLVISDANGDPLVYIASGTGDPVGSPAPINSYYFRQDTKGIYYKFDVGDNDWRQLSLADIETRFVWSEDLCMALDDNLCPIVAD